MLANVIREPVRRFGSTLWGTSLKSSPAVATMAQKDSNDSTLSIAGPLKISTRQVHRKWLHWPNNFLPFYWEKPEQTPGWKNGGDQETGIPEHDPSTFKSRIYELSKELKDAPEPVRRLYSLELARRKEITDWFLEETISEYRRHAFDVSSLEYRIAHLTVRIRSNQEIIEPLWKHSYLRKMVNGKIFKRHSFLVRLYYLDEDAYHRICKSLKITHRIPKLGGIELPIQRKRELRRITSEYCDKIRADKLNKYHEHLKQEQAIFEEERRKIMEWIDQQEKYLGITPSSQRSPSSSKTSTSDSTPSSS